MKELTAKPLTRHKCYMCDHPDMDAIKEWYERGIPYWHIVDEFDIDKSDLDNGKKRLKGHAKAFGWVRPVRMAEMLADPIDRYLDERDEKKRLKYLNAALKAVEIEQRRLMDTTEGQWWRENVFEKILGMRPVREVEVVDEEPRQIEGETEDG